MPDVSLLLIDRRGDVDLARAEREALSAADGNLDVDVVRVIAPDRPPERPQPVDWRARVVAPGRPWAEAVLAGLELALAETVVVLDVARLGTLAGALRLAAQLGDTALLGARLSTPDGAALVFDGGAFSVERYAWSPGADADGPGRRRPSLWCDGRAFAARRTALVSVGAPAPAFDDLWGDVDWSWRLLLAGHTVEMSADVTLRTRAELPARVELLPTSVRTAVRHRAALTLLLQTLDDRGVDAALARYAVTQVTRDAGAAAEALTRVLAGPPDIGARRAEVQATRRVDDAALFGRVGDPLGGPDARRALTGGSTGTGVVVRGRDRRRRVAVLCADTIGGKMAGPAIRAVETARVLARDLDVTIGVRALVEGADLPCPTVVLSDDAVDRLLGSSDALVVQGDLTRAYPQLLDADVPLAVDLYDPMNLEALEHPDAPRLVPHVVGLLLEQLERGDFFVCASERQRDYWLGMLAAAGRVTAERYAEDPDLRLLLDIAPFGTPAEPPVRTGPGVRGRVAGIHDDDPLFIWNGGLWDWFDPESFVRAVDLARRQVPTLRAYFMGISHPHAGPEQTDTVRRVLRLSDELGLTDRHVFFNSWTAYDERQNTYLDATAIVSLHPAHLESRFSFRTRFLDGLWAGVPSVSTEGDVFADLIRQEGLGLVVPPSDDAAAAAAMVRLATEPALLEASRARLHAIAPRYHWENAVAPLAAWLAAPTRTGTRRTRTSNGAAPVTPVQALDVEQILAHLQAAGRELRRGHASGLAAHGRSVAGLVGRRFR